MATGLQQQQTVPVQMHQTPELLVLAALMPGLEPEDITVAISGARLIVCGEYRGSRHDQPEVLLSEWTIGPYYREVILPQSVNGELTNATYGNGVLVLSMPKLAPGAQGGDTEFRLQALTDTRGQRVGHTGAHIEPTTTQARGQRKAQASRQTDRQ
jgi:HSP20 family protein